MDWRLAIVTGLRVRAAPRGECELHRVGMGKRGDGESESDGSLDVLFVRCRGVRRVDRRARDIVLL